MSMLNEIRINTHGCILTLERMSHVISIVLLVTSSLGLSEDTVCLTLVPVMMTHSLSKLMSRNEFDSLVTFLHNIQRKLYVVIVTNYFKFAHSMTHLQMKYEQLSA